MGNVNKEPDNCLAMNLTLKKNAQKFELLGTELLINP